jgi:hypothetical protein
MGQLEGIPVVSVRHGMREFVGERPDIATTRVKVDSAPAAERDVVPDQQVPCQAATPKGLGRAGRAPGSVSDYHIEVWPEPSHDLVDDRFGPVDTG